MSDLPSVPFVDLKLQHLRLADKVRAAMDDVIAKTAYILGPHVEQFEVEFANYCGTDYAIGVANGTDAVELALRGAGIGLNDEVILPANTFVATAEAVVRCGAVPVLVDCDEDFLIDVTQVAARVTDRTRAIIPVHLYGQAAPVELIQRAVGPDILIVEDAAQAQGAERWGRRAGSLGDVAATSFYPGKNLGAYGDAGAVMTSSSAMADRIRTLRNHGGIRKYEHTEVGVNSRLDGLQAAVLSVKLGVLDEWNRERSNAANGYGRLLGDSSKVALPRVADGNKHVWHLYVVRVQRRDEVLAALNAARIGAGIHYPTPVHLLPAFRLLGHAKGDFPVSERMAQEILSLPIYPGITSEQQNAVAAILLGAVDAR